MKEIVIHFGEIWLKGRNRGSFIKKLQENIETTLKGEKYSKLENARDRFILHLNKSSKSGSIENKLKHVFGVSWFAPVITVSNKQKDIITACTKLYGKNDNVRIEVKRSFKGLDYNSQDLVGEFLRNKKKINFIMDRNADTTLFINLTRDGALIHTSKIRGLGGLPVGAAGKCIVLLSGGIDSPVAAYYAMKRGLRPIYLHVHAFPTNEKAKRSKIKKIVELLSQYSTKSNVYYLPSADFIAAMMKVPRQFELVIFKRYIYKLAEKIAKEEGAEVIVTGESLGQVASQTVKNLIATEFPNEMFVMRPLIGFDKQEIINVAQKIGTYDLSTQEYPDVCSIRVLNPSTAAKREMIDKLYKSAKLDSIAKKTLGKGDVVTI